MNVNDERFGKGKRVLFRRREPASLLAMEGSDYRN